LVAGIWQHVTFTLCDAAAKIYLDGTDVTATPDVHIAPDSSVRDTFIGIYGFTLGAGWVGSIGEARIYSDALTPSEVLANYNATKWKYDASDSFYDYAYVGAGVPDNPNDWVVCSANTTPYMDTFDIDITGVNKYSIKWEYGTTFTDLSGNGNDATPTFRTASSDADVSASLSSFLPISEAKAPAYSLSDAPDFFTVTPGVTGDFTANITPAYPGRDVIVAVAAAGAVPETLPTLIFSSFILLVISLGFSYAMKTTGVNSLFIKMCVITAAMCLLVAFKIFDVWQIYFFVLIGLALCWLSRQREAY